MSFIVQKEILDHIESFIEKHGYAPSFEEIADGKWDHLPEQAFMYVGAIEQAEEQAKSMAEDA